jgi:hypothetical protein
MSARTRRIGRRAAIGTALLAVAAVATWYAVGAQWHGGPAGASRAAVGAAPVTRGTVTERLAISGSLGYGGAYQVVHQGAPGVLTATAPAGGTVSRGGALYAVADQPTRLLYGELPGYRDFAAGMSDGPDVRELEVNLVALGLDPRHAIVVDNHFSAATGAALRRWQQSWGWPVARRTGALPVGQVVFLPGPVRITEVQVQPGRSVGPDQQVLAVTSTELVVTAQLAITKQGMVRLGDTVTVTMAGLPAFPGRVARLGTAASAAATGNGGGSAQAAGPLTVELTVTVTLPAAARAMTSAPVQVTVAGQSHPDVLLVPLIALLAKPGGGYRVRLAAGGYVDVRPGLYDETTGLVEVDGALSAGDRVEVPAR